MRHLLLGLLLFVTVSVACPSTTQAPLPDRLTVFFSNETGNELFPGGRHNRMGGMSRRATTIAEGDPESTLVVDVGRFSARRPDNEYDLFKQDYLLRIYNSLGYSALNVGPMEFQLGKTRLERLNSLSGDRLVAANVVNYLGAPVLPPYRIVSVSGLKVGIAGLLAEQPPRMGQEASERLRTTDPVTSLGAIWPQLERSSDLQIVLSQLPDAQLDPLVTQFPGIDAILGGPAWRGATEMLPVPKAGVAYGKIGNRGKYVGRLDLTIEGTHRKGVRVSDFQGRVIGMGDDVPNNPAVDQILDEFKTKLRAPGGPFQDQFDHQTEGAQYRFSGAQNCYGCHGAIYAGYLRTRHAQAFQTLSARGEQNNPGCLPCHTVGYGEPGGYGSAPKGPTQLLANVQCESCHGAASDHADLAMRWKEGMLPGKPTDWMIERPKPPAETCTKCHDPDNDPDWADGKWAFASKVAQIACTQWLGSPAPTTGVSPAVPVPTPWVRPAH